LKLFRGESQIRNVIRLSLACVIVPIGETVITCVITWTDLWSSAATSEPPTFCDLFSTADEKLLNKIVTNSNHILHTLLPLPSTASQHYTSRRRSHSLQLPAWHPTHLYDSNFILRMLYKKCYWHTLFFYFISMCWL